MTPGPAATIAVLAALALPFAGRSRAGWRAVVIVAATGGTVAGIGTPDLAGADGFLIEPVRAWGVLAIVASLAAAAVLRTTGSVLWGPVAAGGVLALLSGHAAVALGALIVADWTSALIASGERPWTLRASVRARSPSLLLLTSDALLAAAVLNGSPGAAEPLAFSAGLLATLAIGARLLAVLGIDAEQPAVAPVLVAVPVLLPLSWLAPADARASVLVVSLVAAVAAMRWARTGHRTGFVAAFVGLLAVAAGTGEPALVTLVPILVILAIAAVALPDLVRGGAMLVVAAAGAALLPAADVLTTALLDAHDRWLELGGVACVITLAALGIGAFGVTRPDPQRERGELWRIPAGVVIGGLLALVVAVPQRIVTATEDAVLDARTRGALHGDPASIAGWIPIASLATLLVFALAAIHPRLRTMHADRLGAREPRMRVTPATELDLDLRGGWVRATLVIAGLAVLGWAAVLIRSLARGWL